jgi:hypothetical protein
MRTRKFKAVDARGSIEIEAIGRDANGAPVFQVEGKIFAIHELCHATNKKLSKNALAALLCKNKKVSICHLKGRTQGFARYRVEVV